MDISQVGNSVSVQCRTDLSTCCSGAQGIHHGDGYFPNGTRLPFPDGSDIIESRQAQRVDLCRNRGTGPTGIYGCDIETVAGNGDGMRVTVYVGLFTSDGGKLTLLLSRKSSLYSDLLNMYVYHSLGSVTLTCNNYTIAKDSPLLLESIVLNKSL